MKRIHSPNRLSILLLAFVCAMTSFAKDYKFKVTHTGYLGEIKIKSNYQLIYDSSSDKTIEFKELDYSSSKTIIKSSGVTASFVSEEYLVSNDFLIPYYRSDGGILFRKNGKNLCLVFISTTEDDSNYIAEEEIIYWENGDWSRASGSVEKSVSKLQGDEAEFYKTFMALKKDLTSGTVSSSPKTTNTAVTKTNSTSTSSKTPVQTSSTKKDSDTPYTATVTNPRYHLRKPGQNISEWLINYDVINSRQMDRWNYLYVQNADTKEWLKSHKTGKEWFSSSANGTNMLTFSLSADDLPPATEEKPIRLKMWIFMQTYHVEGWIGKFETPVFIWDGKYMRQE